MVRGRKGNVSTLFLGLIVFGAIIFNSLVIIERKTASIKRQNIHNAVVAANLAAYRLLSKAIRHPYCPLGLIYCKVI